MGPMVHGIFSPKAFKTFMLSLLHTFLFEGGRFYLLEVRAYNFVHISQFSWVITWSSKCAFMTVSYINFFSSTSSSCF